MTDALKINKVAQTIDAINGFTLAVGGKEVYHPDNLPSAATLGVVNKAGDTMSGNLTAPKVLVSAAQGTEANALTRKDYVDQKFAGVTSPTANAPLMIDANKVISIKPAAKDTSGSMSAADKNKLDGMQGFAVNGKSEKLKGPIDFDSIESTGFYNIYNGTAAGSVNAPIQYGTLIVIGADKDANTFVTQIATNKNTNEVFIRSRTDGAMAWTGWVKQYSTNSKPTLDELNAAPAGFGLGEKSGFSLSGKSCNDAVESGFYSVFDGTKDTPYGTTGPSGSSLLVQRWGTGVCTQTFISYQADRMHIRRQYKGEWLPWVEVLTENNGVAVSGGVMTGALDMKVPGALGQGNYSIKLNNGAIGGINQLVFADPTEYPSEGIYFPKEGKNDQSAVTEDYDIVRAYNGVLYFNNKSAYGEWNKPSASDVGAFKLELSELTVDLNTIGVAGVYRQSGNVRATPENNYPVALAGTLVVTPSAYGSHQEYTTFTGRKFQRGLTAAWNSKDGPWGAWTEFFSEITPSIKVMPNKNAIAVNNKGSISFQDNANTRFHLLSDGNNFRLSHGLNAENSIITVTPDGNVNSTGTFTAKDFIQSTAQLNNAAASTRKDYVDAQIAAIDAKNVTKAGDTMTGPLAISMNSTSSMMINLSNTTNGWTWMQFGNQPASKYGHLAFNTDAYGGSPANSFHIRANGNTQMSVSPNAINTFVNTYVNSGQFQITTGSTPVLEFHVPGKHARVIWLDGTTGDLNLSTSNGAFGEAARIAQFRGSGTGISLWGNIWASKNAHSWANQYAQAAPFNVDFGTVPGGSDYYQIVKGRTVANQFGYTTDVELGTLRQGGATWGTGIIRVGSGEGTSAGSQAIYSFDISGNFTAANVRITSDARLKSDFKPIVNALDKVEQLSGKTYIKKGKQEREAGIIAQDLQKVQPESVGEFYHEDGNKYLTIEGGGVNALLIEAIKELSAKVKELEAKGK
ncbi:pyocin knob domain-containing S74 family peptidase [Aeromonas salmonicida]|uniref:pyocin knob domain-containing S74 family peptidase n=1 Tax=Aeromonas salmonicida TaxID=645 RepID=UPI003D31B202